MLQYIASLLFRQINIENDQCRTRHIRAACGLIEKPYCLLSIADDTELKGETGCLHGFPNQEHVGFIVFDNKYAKRRAGGPFVKREA
jgi:hypothetical protein